MPPAVRRREPGVGRERFRLGLRPELDGLRGLAVLAVMAYHADPRGAVRGGFLGVDLFLVLSGFLITAVLLREQRETGSIRLGRFYLRRAFRLLPALAVMLAVCCAWAALRTGPARAAVIYRAAALTACQAADCAPCCSSPLDILGHAWSLSLEEKFYLLWPILLLSLLRCGVNLRRTGWLVVMGIAASALFRAGLWLSPRPNAALGLVARTDALLAGCLIGLIAMNDRLPQSPGFRKALGVGGWASAALLVVLGGVGEAGAAYLHLGGLTVVAAAAAVVVAAVVNAPHGPAARVLGAPPLAWVGRISYGLYLWHFPLLSIAPKLLHGLFPALRHVARLDAATAYALAFAAATLSYYALERPLLRLRERLDAPAPPPLVPISFRSSRRSGRGTLAASSARAGCPA